MLVYFMTILNISWPFAIFYSHLVCFAAILVYFPRFGTLCQEKSGNPDLRAEREKVLETCGKFSTSF
jgi:hypothetical protein